MPKLTIIRGVSGSGKTTLAKELGSPYFEADQYFEKSGEYIFDRTKLKEAHAECFENVSKSLLSGCDTTVSNTFVRKWEYLQYIDFCRQNGFEYEILICNGSFKNVHDVPNSVIETMKHNFEY